MQYSHIDTAYLEEISDGNSNLIVELIDIFFNQLVDFKDMLNNLYESAEYDQLQKIIHKAKSAFAVVGSHKMVEILGINEEKDFNSIEEHKFRDFQKQFLTISEKVVTDLTLYRNTITHA